MAVAVRGFKQRDMVLRTGAMAYAWASRTSATILVVRRVPVWMGQASADRAARRASAAREEAVDGTYRGRPADSG